jgi:hypothetical protein
MKFKLGTITAELICGAQFSYPQSVSIVQAKERTATGIVHTESFHVKLGEYVYTFKDMGDADYAVLMDWFVNVVDAMFKSFYLTDDLGITRHVRFTVPRLSFEQTDFGLWTGDFTVEAC